MTLPDTLRTLDQEATPGRETLRPCPFCSGTADTAGTTGTIFVQCADCLAAGPPDVSTQGAIEDWNTRSHLEAGWQPIEQAERRGEMRAIARLVNVARAIGMQAGVGGRETAGAIASYLATSPDEIAAFMDGTLSPIDFKGDWMRGGCLSWHAVNGKVVHPEALPHPPAGESGRG